MNRISKSFIAVAAIIAASLVPTPNNNIATASESFRGPGLVPSVGQVSKCERLMIKSRASGIGCLILRYGIGGVSDILKAIVLQQLVKDVEAIFAATEDGSRSIETLPEKRPPRLTE